MSTDYVIISPVRNEEQFIENTIKSVLNQTIKPSAWIIVDDGSTDRTGEILKFYSCNHPWIKIIHKADRGYDNPGIAEAEAFNHGYKNIAVQKWDYIVKLDGDISFEKDYFERIIGRFNKNKRLGIAGGTCFFLKNRTMLEEKSPIYFPLAAARMYQKRCFEEMGGLQNSLGFDVIDILRAQMRGWETERIPELKFTHHRQTMSRNGVWRGKSRLGEIFYVVGYSPVFFTARSLWHLFQRPYIIESCASAYGFFKAMITGKPFVVSLDEIAYLRTQQTKRLLHPIKGIKYEAANCND